ncbi:traB domain-containing isoform X1 [Micractinium conductrix]|uniref:TraB domain-containing isoform X1 n=1 Tax=Micractinium conductrix TaxID=554055 RepID=A0A2P6V7H1_9CHLO|nr:traB domain-containing isoform X1 [Micractinium conductrix]|eukprot:PSC70033.1 traB domain-containing isoform X1 [Micractinium conductrix]
MRPLVLAATRQAPLVQGPPQSYDHRALRDSSAALLARLGGQHAQLLPLVQQGNLVALERPASYVERREDGYREPELLFLVGTAHVSQQSAADVRRVVQAVQPDALVVELCRSRQAVMYPAPEGQQRQDVQQQQGAAGALQSLGSGSSIDEAAGGQQGSGSGSGSGGGKVSTARNLLSLSGGGLLPAFQRSMELGGASALLLRLLLGRLSARMAGSLGVSSGAEFVAAREEAEVLAAQLVLGDRPIEITLQRAWDALSWRQRLRLGTELAEGLLSVQQGSLEEAAVERLKEDDAVSLLFAALGQQYPELVAPLIHERDLYLAWSLKRSKAVNGARAVVGVVGKGHLRGVCYALTHDAAGAQLRFSDLVGGKNVKADRARARAAAAGRFALETVVVGAAWAAWTALQQ